MVNLIEELSNPEPLLGSHYYPVHRNKAKPYWRPRHFVYCVQSVQLLTSPTLSITRYFP